MWNLQRNGGSRADTTERMLSGRGLEAVSYNALTAGTKMTKLTSIASGFIPASYASNCYSFELYYKQPTKHINQV